MARKKKDTLPNKIELIDEKRGNVIEFELTHAQRILSLQDKINLGAFKIYNTQLYRYEQGVISLTEQPSTDSTELQAVGGQDEQ